MDIFFNEQNIEVNLNDTFLVSDFIHLSGAPDGAKLTIFARNTQPQIRAFDLIIEHNIFETNTKIQIHQEDDELVLHIELIVLKGAYQKQGLLTQMFSRQVERARALQFSSITLKAERGKSLNGYYTWARLGFNAKIDDVFKEYIKKYIKGLPKTQIVEPDIKDFVDNHFDGCQDVLDILETDGGRKFWRKYGTTMEMEFDLDENSKSVLALNKYLMEKSQNHQNSE